MWKTFFFFFFFFLQNFTAIHLVDVDRGNENIDLLVALGE